ncbi:MAG: hypothetical protein AB1753_02185 [Thermoproteota archaeon]
MLRAEQQPPGRAQAAAVTARAERRKRKAPDGQPRGASNNSNNMLKAWQRRLGLEGYAITLERVSVLQVSDDLCSVGNSFVGVCADHGARSAVIYHTRRLGQEDIVHELLHVRHPEWPEERVKEQTALLLGRGVINTL